MKTTIDLPDELVRKLKMRAVRDRRKLKDLAADLLRTGLASPGHGKKRLGHTIVKDRKTGLPVIACGKAPRGAEVGPERVAGLLSEQEATWAQAIGSGE